MTADARPRDDLGRIVQPTAVMAGIQRRHVVAITINGKYDVTATPPGTAMTAGPIPAMSTYAQGIVTDSEGGKELLIRTYYPNVKDIIYRQL